MATTFPVQRPALPFIHPDDMPDVYALRGVGTCMEPAIKDGELAAFDKRKAPQPGDIVCVTFNREDAPRYGVPGYIKRLAEPLPAIGAADGIIVLDMLNPPRRMTVRASHVLAVHTFLCVAQSQGNGIAAVPRSALSGEGR